jgi:hypothetical protein
MRPCQPLLTVLLHVLAIHSLLYVCPVRAVVAAVAAQQQQKTAAAQPGTTAAAAAATGPPSFCKLADADVPVYANAAGPTTMVWGGNMLKVYHNLYFHNK